MKTNTKATYEELYATSRLWIAASQAKDERIEQLEAECHRLRQILAKNGHRTSNSMILAARPRPLRRLAIAVAAARRA